MLANIDMTVMATIGGFATLKGTVLAFVALAITHDLSDALIVAGVSGVLGVIGMSLAAWISTRSYNRRIHPDMRDLKRATGADRRATDHGEPDPCRE